MYMQCCGHLWYYCDFALPLVTITIIVYLNTCYICVNMRGNWTWDSSKQVIWSIIALLLLLYVYLLLWCNVTSHHKFLIMLKLWLSQLIAHTSYRLIICYECPVQFHVKVFKLKNQSNNGQCLWSNRLC